ncbi:hypothetical protein ACE1CD_36680 [Aerosakkonema sp. BLCC-F183]
MSIGGRDNATDCDTAMPSYAIALVARVSARLLGWGEERAIAFIVR